MAEEHRNPHQAYTLNDFREKYFKLPKHKAGMTDADLIKAIKDGEFFGIVQCNIEVPDHLKADFAEMQPIFKNCDVSRDDIGEHMKAYCEKNNEWRDPRRMLVGSYFGEGIALITPLLQWYLNHGEPSQQHLFSILSWFYIAEKGKTRIQEESMQLFRLNYNQDILCVRVEAFSVFRSFRESGD